jgi:hypothetical protein
MIFSEIIYAFVWISEHTLIISLYNINWLFPITEGLTERLKLVFKGDLCQWYKTVPLLRQLEVEPNCRDSSIIQIQFMWYLWFVKRHSIGLNPSNSVLLSRN